jgi:hypothetical protein
MFLARSVQSQEGKHGQDHDDQTDDVDNAVHGITL